MLRYLSTNGHDAFLRWVLVKLFDRSSRYPRLTGEGRELLQAAREVAAGVDGFKARARTMREGLEPEL